MISLLPTHHETIVIPKPAEDVYRILAAATSNKPFLQSNENKLAFNGWVKEEKFRFSLRVHRPNNYLPLVLGKIESSSSGCILMVDYHLFPTIRLLMTLWTVLLVLGSVFGSFQTKNIIFLLGGVGIIFIIHFIVWSNFKIQLRPTQEALHQLLS